MICINFQIIYIDVSLCSEVKKIQGLNFSKLSFKVEFPAIQQYAKQNTLGVKV